MHDILEDGERRRVAATPKAGVMGAPGEAPALRLGDR
jgi:hypothetical protein